MQLDTQKHEVSQYLRSAHANRHAEARVSRCINTKHAEGQVDVEVSYGMDRSPDQSIQDIGVGFWDLASRYQDEDLEGRKMVWFLTSETASELGKPVRSRCQFVDPRLETMSGLTGRGPESGGLGLTWLDHQDRVSHVDVAAPGESDRGPGTAILIEDRDRPIPERLRLCGVIVKGLPVSLMWRKNDSVGP
ncbi:hypothetical protein F2Q69_00004590 [Brassica cretica]|uniref:Uncharacterized protein n=1 Tax=Brassica cretica TaxID=69181 RepID=A0A8S9PFM8_BRACR|nr:hypothetical protein F2Q69_00004590 [Brassica cretica]